MMKEGGGGGRRGASKGRRCGHCGRRGLECLAARCRPQLAQQQHDYPASSSGTTTMILRHMHACTLAGLWLRLGLGLGLGLGPISLHAATIFHHHTSPADFLFSDLWSNNTAAP
jgi:hypothetical protein